MRDRSTTFRKALGRSVRATTAAMKDAVAMRDSDRVLHGRQHRETTNKGSPYPVDSRHKLIYEVGLKKIAGRLEKSTTDIAQ